MALDCLFSSVDGLTQDINGHPFTLTMDVEKFIYLLLALLQGTCGTGLSSTFLSSEDSSLADATGAHQSSGAPLRPRRFKRCSCSSLMDKECVYFCHLDIIWINTPEKTVPYGLGGPRLKRSLQDTKTEKVLESASRCICAKREDKKCLDFCQSAADLSIQPSTEKETGQVQKGKVCKGLLWGARCVEKLHADSKRTESIRQAIKSSYVFASLLKKLQEMKDETRPWAHRKRGIWKHTITTS
ncbi:endothelin-1 [Hyla sarda]|uniref:endothelin-1 n=1 Tax=Hyla sarda TaxID=327740 RepID=UPI0024C22C57|nr:endothelin-1 [Hyla sarda]